MTKEDLVQFNKDARIIIDDFTNKLQKLYEKLVTLDKHNIESVADFTKELNKELSKSIIMPDEEMKEYITEDKNKEPKNA